VVGHPQMLLRLGYASDDVPPTAGDQTPRRPVEDVLDGTED